MLQGRPLSVTNCLVLLPLIHKRRGHYAAVINFVVSKKHQCHGGMVGAEPKTLHSIMD